MNAHRVASKKSVFEQSGFGRTVEEKVREIVSLYLEDQIPWVIGYSGGKDSTAALQLVWLALRTLDESKRMKRVYVISTDTLVENPVVASWVETSLHVMRDAADQQKLPVTTHRLTPRLSNTFWVNLIGRGYPAPRPKFRWCTDRLKIAPSNDFISSVVRETGEAIVVLGTRKAESRKRASVMGKLETARTRDHLSRNTALPNSFVYTPIEDWTNDDVWVFLMQVANPWGYNNHKLLTLYQGASEGGECPLVIDTSSPSCGDSRFGCWVCTLVDKDKSMAAMIQNDEEKEWMIPLLEFRDILDVADDRYLRDFRRMTGKVQIFHDRAIPGPYRQSARENWLRKLLEIQLWLSENGPPHLSDVEIITLQELREIRRIWVVEKHEMEDSVPAIYKSVMGRPFPDGRLDEAYLFSEKELMALKDICGQNELLYQLVRELLDIEKTYRNMERRAGLFDAFEHAFRRGFYSDEDDATARAQRLRRAMDAAKTGKYDQPSLFPQPGNSEKPVDNASRDT